MNRPKLLDSVNKIVNYAQDKIPPKWSHIATASLCRFLNSMYLLGIPRYFLSKAWFHFKLSSFFVPTFFFLFLIVSPGDKPLCRHHQQSFCPSKLRILKVSKALAVVFHLFSFIVEKLLYVMCALSFTGLNPKWLLISTRMWWMMLQWVFSSLSR